jgi:cation diffusion facilitator family transporter
MENRAVKDLIGLGALAIGVNVSLMIIKIIVGMAGNSYALVADGIESASDIFTSLITWSGFHLSLKPPDRNHPFGHGKIESLAGIFSGISLLAAAAFIAFSSVREIYTPHHAPEWFTLPVLLLVVLVKEVLSRKMLTTGNEIGSQAIQGDAWHHRSDAITSGAAAIGIAIALIGGKGYEMADDCAALVACVIIVINGVAIIRTALHDILDGHVDYAIADSVKNLAENVEGVSNVEKVRIRKSGISLYAELHVRVDANMTVFQGHAISHAVKDKIMAHDNRFRDVLIHLEPDSPLKA